jgi:hypothetical protein
VDVDARRVVVYRAGRALRRYGSIVGNPSTPTPRGDFFVEENSRMAAGRSPSAGNWEPPSRTGACACPTTRSHGSPQLWSQAHR